MIDRTKDCVKCGDPNVSIIHDSNSWQGSPLISGYYCAECYLKAQKQGYLKFRNILNVEKTLAERRASVIPTTQEPRVKVERRRLYE